MGNFFRGQDNEQDDINRTFDLNVPEQQYGTNQIKSTTSSVFTFIPLNLLHQFKNLPNLYFLLIVIMQCIPEISVTGGQPTTLIPLAFVILTVMIKDAYEQFQRFLKDRQQNQRKVQILTYSGFQQQQWENIMCGHVFKVKQDQLIPCDALVLKSNLPQNKCFLETKSLDGQTNLKSRKAPVSKYNLDQLSNQQLSQQRFQIQVQPPNQFLNNIKGFIKIKNQDVPISIDNVILRGCHLRNCAEVICVALYVGSDTKVIINSAKFSAKKSKMMIEIDKMVMSIFIWQIMIALVVSIFNTLFENSYENYVNNFGNSKFWLLVPSWWLMMTYFVPISLIVTMQLIKLFQGGIINKDRRGFSNQYNCYISSNNTSINQNLGQIKYVFTDKTGTLTKNQMNFKKIIVNGQRYGERTDILEAKIKSQFPKTTNVNFRDSTFFNKIQDKNIQQMLMIIYLCHDVFVDKKSDGRILYNSSSPDQIALVNFAKLCGKQLIGEEYGYIKILDHRTQNIIKFKKLALLEFSSDRKRMSVIVKTPDGQILMVTKGADSSVQKVLAKNQQNLQKTNKVLQQFSIQGLRTLMLAKKIISQNQFNDWDQKYRKAAASIKDREKSLEQVYKIIQRNLQLVGGTAVQDKLQDDVQSTIIKMKNAGIKFFILTGDKKQTAVNIGRSAGLISQKARIVSYPQQYTQQVKNDQNDKVYLIDASDQLPQLPPDLFYHQTICYRCTPIQKQNIVKYVKQRKPDLTLAIGDGANDVNMITSADVGIGVKGKQGTQATRVSDVSIGQFKFLAFITLYYGRQWYRKNANLACYNFYKNWYHVAAVITYGAYSYFSAVQIFDIYLYELFNAFFASLPIIIYAIFDQQYTYEQSLRFPQLYSPGLLNSYFNQTVYYRNIGQGLLCGFLSIIIIYMVLQDDLLSINGRTGYLQQSGAVLFFNIILIVNLKILVMSNGITIGLVLSILISIFMYWLIYFVETLYFTDFILKYSFFEEWYTPQILFLHIILITVFSISQFSYRLYKEFHERGYRIIREKKANPIIASLANKIFDNDRMN